MKLAELNEENLRHVLTRMAAFRSENPMFKAGVLLAVEEIGEWFGIAEPTDEEVGLQRLALDLDAAMLKSVEDGKFAIVGRDKFGENIYSDAAS